MLIDLQAKMAAGKGAGYERWAKAFNLKEAAKTLNFLVENGLTDYDELAAMTMHPVLSSSWKRGWPRLPR